MEQDLLSPEPRALSLAGKVTVGIVGAGVIGSVALTLPFILPAVRKICLPYVPATEEQVTNIVKALGGRRGTLVDLGSGDGRIVSLIKYSWLLVI